MSIKKNLTKEYYEKNSGIWTEKKTNSFFHEESFVVFNSLLQERASVIDIGCSWGIHVPLFLGIGRKMRYEGMDIAWEFLKIARRRYPQLTFYQSDIADAKTLPSKKYDGFWAGAILMHIPIEDWGQMFQNIEKLTKKGAVGYLSLPTEHPNGDEGTDSRHFTLLTEKEQVQIIKDRGWVIIKKGKMDGFTKKGIWKWYIVRLP